MDVDLNGEWIDGVMDLTLPPSGLRILKTDGQGPLKVGSATVYSDRKIGGVLLFGGDIGLSGVGGSDPLQHGFVAPMEAKVTEEINTGIAMVNLTSQTMTVDLLLCDRESSVLANSQVTLDARGHLALYINEFEWDQYVDFSNFLGILKASAQSRLAATVIQTRPGEFATMPVVPRLLEYEIAAIPSESTLDSGQDYELCFAQFADGAGQFFSQILLINQDERNEANAKIHLRDKSGHSMSVDLNGDWIEGQLDFTVPAGGLKVFQTDGVGLLTVGSVVVTSDRPLSGVVLFGGSVGLAGVGVSEILHNGFTAPMETRSVSGINTGIALMNLEQTEVTLDLQLQDSEGKYLAFTQIVLPGKGQQARFVNEIDWFDSIDFTNFLGVLRVTSTGAIAATVIQTRPGQFATMPIITK
jgi:hypothetical protein